MTPDRFKVIRDPLWNNIQIAREALDVIDSEPFQRLRYVRQLGHAFLVYPGATHTRFEHAVGTYHLADRALRILADRRLLDDVPADEQRLVKLAALLHDIGHYPFSHGLEEAGLPSHEELAARHLRHQDLARSLTDTGLPNVTERIVSLIKGSGDSPLGGLISGSLDLDKIDYLTRDARMCGVPYGAVDVDRLLHALTVVRHPDDTLAVGIREKGVSALESLLFARYQMYRNVYWHHAVRSATSMFKRIVRTARHRNLLDDDWLANATDEILMGELRRSADTALAARLQRRDLYKRMAEVPSRQIPEGAGDWIATHPELLERVEDRLAAELGLAPGELLLDYPRKAHMIDVDMPLQRRDGSVDLLSGQNAETLLSIQRIAAELHANARWLRVFTGSQVALDAHRLIGAIERTPDEMASALERGETLLV